MPEATLDKARYTNGNAEITLPNPINKVVK